MNIFEDLIDELKEDNLLEETVFKSHSGETKPLVSSNNLDETAVVFSAGNEETLTPQVKEFTSAAAGEKPDSTIADSSHEKDFQVISQDLSGLDEASQIELETNQVQAVQPSVREAEFFRKRANDEVAFLQMVEHVFAGIEREQMKIVPKPYDALEVKKVLHTFLQVSKEENSNKQTQAEFQLLQETENWYSTLTHRDKRISINHLRRYCETAKPTLSSPALISLARFYRNSPYSEQVRGKFDFVVTRLFSKDIENEQRKIAFEREELVKHLKELYAEWSSIPLYPNEDDSKILLIALKFEDFMTEAAVAANFDELIKNDFFNRLRLFKKDTNENFFSPLIVAANIESNIKIGNRYVELLEKEKSNKSLFEDKYGFLHDQSISDATGKTFQLVELLNRKTEKPPVVKTQSVTKRETKTETATVREAKKDSKNETKTGRETKTPKDKSKTEISVPKKQESKDDKSFYGLNSWVLTAVIFVIVATVGIYIWSNNSSSEAREVVGVKTVNLENSSLKEQIKTATIKSEIFSATVLPSWNNLPPERKQELLKKIMSIGADKGFKNVQLLNDAGKTVGSASAEKVETYNP